MTGKEFWRIRTALHLTQKELAQILGYAHKIRISEFERTANPLPVPEHIARAMHALGRERGVAPEAWGAVREWNRRAG